jgi:sugar phosphate isomerase/epimerase
MKLKHSFMSFSCPELTLPQLLELARKLGYDGIEPRIQDKHAHLLELDSDAATRKAARKEAERAGIAICCIATSCQFADPQTLQETMETARRSIDLASDVGAARLRVFGGPIGKGLDRAAAIEQVSRSLASLAEQARKRGVVVCMETHDDWCDPRHVAEVMRKVDHPFIAVNWDFVHVVRTGKATIDESYRLLRPWIRHMHIHDAKIDGDRFTLVPIGTGDIDHRRVVELALADGYDGYLSGEWIRWEPYQTHLPRELATLKQYEAQAGQGGR